MVPVITGAVTLISAISIVAERIAALKKSTDELKKSTDGIIGAAANLGTTDLITLTKVARMEPLVLVDDTLKYDPVMPDVMQVLTSLIAGYYIQAFGVLGSVDGVNLIGTLDKLNPNRIGMGLNSFDGDENDMKLPALHDTPIYSIGCEALEEKGNVTASVDKTSVADVTQATNLIVGKMIKVSLTRNGVSAEVNIVVRPTPISTASDVVAAILSVASTKNTIKERWHRFRSGELTWKNMFFADDVVEEHKKLLMKDTSGVYGEIVRRASKNKAKGLLSGNPSLATDSNIIVISQATAIKAGRELGGPIENFDIRQRIFSHIHSNVIVVVNQNSSMVTLYYRGERMATERSFVELKLSNKSGGPDIMEIYKSFMTNQVPAL